MQKIWPLEVLSFIVSRKKVIKHFFLYSRVDIKTLKQGKTMFGYQTLKVC